HHRPRFASLLRQLLPSPLVEIRSRRVGEREPRPARWGAGRGGWVSEGQVAFGSIGGSDGAAVATDGDAEGASQLDDFERSPVLVEGEMTVLEFGPDRGEGPGGDIERGVEYRHGGKLGRGDEGLRRELHGRSPSDCRMRAMRSRSTVFRFRRTAQRRARVAMRSTSRRLPAAASWSKAMASEENSSLLPPARVTRMRTSAVVSSGVSGPMARR